MRSFFYACLLLAPTLAQAQPVSRAASVGVSVQRSSHFYTTFDGFPVNEKKFSGLVSGSPYLSEGFMPASIVLANGNAYDGVRVRLNLVDNEVQYLDSKGSELVTKVPLKQIVIRDTVTGTEKKMVSSFALPADAPREGWYELLADGKASLYKLQEKRLITEKPFNSASEEQRVETKNRYFVVKDGRYQEVKKPKDLLLLFAGKEAEIDSFLKKQKSVSASWEQTATEAVKYYNELTGEKAKPAV